MYEAKSWKHRQDLKVRFRTVDSAISITFNITASDVVGIINNWSYRSCRKLYWLLLDSFCIRTAK